MQIAITQIVELPPEKVRDVFHRYLDSLKDGRWTRDNKLVTDAYTSHRFDIELGGPDHPDFALVQAVEVLQQILRDKDKKASQ